MAYPGEERGVETEGARASEGWGAEKLSRWRVCRVTGGEGGEDEEGDTLCSPGREEGTCPDDATER
jgi:hypothetical protein